MADYYRTHFVIDDEELQGIRLLDEVEGIVRHWAEERYGKALGDKLTGEWSHDNNGVRISIERGRLEKTQSGYWSLMLEHPDRNTDAIQWHVEFQCATAGRGIDVGTVVQRIGATVKAKDRGIGASRPNVLMTLSQRFSCKLGEEPVTTKAEQVTENDAKYFVSNKVFDPNRRLPLIVVSENRFGGVFMSADYLQSRLLGLARVASYTSSTARAVNKELGESLGCWDGTLRIYRPGCSPQDASWQNRYWIWTRMNSILRSSGWDEILLEVEDECVSRSLPQIGSRLYDQIRDEVRQARYERVLEQLDQLRQNQRNVTADSVDQRMLDDLVNTLAEYESQQTENERQFNRQLSDYERQNNELRAQNEDLQARVEQLTVALRYSDSDSEETQEADELPPEFKALYEAVEHSTQEFDNLRFFSNAEQLAKASTFPRPSEVYDAFNTLNDCAIERMNGSLGKGVKEWLKERGIDYSPRESDSTMGKYGEQRLFYDQDKRRRIEMQSHLKLGGGLGEHNQLRVHVSWDEDENKWLIGYIGRHLRTVTG